MKFFTRHCYAESTKAAYRTHLNTFLRFTINYDIEPVPISQFNLLAYIAFLARTLRPTSINNYLNIIRILHQDSGFPNPLADNFAVKNLKRGIARQLGSPPEQKLPITCFILRKIRERLDLYCARDIVFWAALTLGFFGFLRKSTLLPISKTRPGDSCIRRCDLEMPDMDTVILHITKTKTIQFKERVLEMPYVASPGNALCPVAAVCNMLEVSPCDPNLPLFSYFERDGSVKSLNHSTFTAQLKACISDVGLDATKYSGHSLRRGGATLGFQLGLSLTQIKKRGDWTSSAVNEYICMSCNSRIEIAKVLVNGSLNSNATW